MTRVLLFSDERSFSVCDVDVSPERLLEQIKAGEAVIPGVDTGKVKPVCRVGDLIVLAPGAANGNQTLAGAPHVTRREREVLQGLVNGQSLKEIARELGVKPRTVQAYIEAIKVKFAAQTREQLIGQAVAWGICRVERGIRE